MAEALSNQKKISGQKRIRVLFFVNVGPITLE